MTTNNASNLLQIQIYALTNEPPILGYENCVKNFVFRDLPACKSSLPAGQIPATDLWIFQRETANFFIGIEYDGAEPVQAITDFLSSFVFINGLKLPDSYSPVSGICEEVQSGEIVEFTLTSSGPAIPRCAKVMGSQRIKLINATGVVVQVNLGPFNMNIPADDFALLDQRVDEYLAPGIHFVNGAEVWVIANPFQ